MAQKDLARRERLANSGAISTEELQHARDTERGAQAALMSAQQQLNGNQARVDGTTLENHPDVRNASAAVRSAYLTYSRTVLPAPVSGFVARRAVQLGQRVGPGAPLMSVVPLDQVWVDANFKEPQLANMRVGQPVMLTADLYGGGFRYHGKIAGFGAGTGSAFALLPRAECHRQLDQDRAARAGAHRAGSAGDGGASFADRIVDEGRGVGARRVMARGCRNWLTMRRRIRRMCFHSVDEAADTRVHEIIAANDSVDARSYGSVKQAAGKLASLQ